MNREPTMATLGLNSLQKPPKKTLSSIHYFFLKLLNNYRMICYLTKSTKQPVFNCKNRTFAFFILKFKNIFGKGGVENSHSVIGPDRPALKEILKNNILFAKTKKVVASSKKMQ